MIIGEKIFFQCFAGFQNTKKASIDSLFFFFHHQDVIMISICSSQQSARVYIVIYHNHDQTINEHTLLWAIHVGSNHDEMPNVAKCLYQANDDQSEGSECSTISCFSLVCCILIAHTTDKASAVRCIEKVEERNDQEHTPTSSKAFVRDAIEMLAHEQSILGKHQLDWDVIEARTVRYSYLQSDDFSQVDPAQNSHVANGLIATYDLINEQDITLRLTKYHQNGLVGFVARKTKCLRTTVYKALQG
ncbi:uncharacterized protein FA14DRAFT_173966 [Meira miltonrushii]|uniref:Uncharacterized protein n=1 Tax=Meira miltonrushii TaxID=1280837 RepID=A0A316V9H8_9BASI|nr:uncharacterized protein FA14DRAFT_173966 [Meira miltonrushii]PWN34269.1 hypothetical protein FA14DRAFT_173966 [Meira miltonrushii]